MLSVVACILNRRPGRRSGLYALSRMIGTSDISTSYWLSDWFTKWCRTAFSIWEQIPGRANEALDCLVYSYAALCGLKHMGLKLNVRAANLEANPDKFLPAPAVPEEKISYELPGAVIEEPAPVKRKKISKLLPQ
jgi:phage terminase large subunit GpA-like protein